MKTRTFVLFFLLLCASVTVHAQYTVGIKVGYHKAWQDYGDDFFIDGFDGKIKGFSTSLIAYRSLGKHFDIGAEPSYIRRGAACEPGFFIDNPYLTGDATLYANYVSLPVFLRNHYPLFRGRMNCSVKLGGSASWLVDGYRHLNLEWTGVIDQVQDINFEDEPNLKRWDSGLQAGAGIGLNIGPGLLQFEYEYYYSLMDMNRQITSKNRNAGLIMAYLIKI